MTSYKKDVCEVPVCSYTRRRRGRLEYVASHCRGLPKR